MISKDDLKRFAKAQKLTLHQQEQHYIQTATLQGIYTSVANELVFKGGTALFFFYGLNRFSEDLDFTRVKPIDIKKLQSTLSDVLSMLNIQHNLKTIPTPAGITIKVKTQGPLYNEPLSTTTVKIDISERNDVVKSPDIKEIIPIYNDLRPITIPVMNKQEILAEKIRAITTRGHARDIYDVSFLLKKGVVWNQELTNKKLAYYNSSFDNNIFSKQVKAIQKIWKAELQGLVPAIPVFEDETSFILNHIKLHSK